MARMYPNDIEGYQNGTKGEKVFFRFLKEAARPHGSFICWYSPTIGDQGIEADFILLGKNQGLLVLEVKDWRSGQIVSGDHLTFGILKGKKVEINENPDKQAKRYVDALREELRKHQLRIPIKRMVVFPNIKKEQYLNIKNLKGLIPTARVMFKDDLAAAGEILRDPSGAKFHDRISPLFSSRFKGLSAEQIKKITTVIGTEVKIDLPVRQGAGKNRFQTEVLYLDKAQERVAFRLKGGHQIIKGPPGSGKTLVLVHRCSNLQKYNPQVKRPLFLCYNIALVSYLKRLFQEKQLGVGQNGISVCHFFELCSNILQERVQYEKEGTDYYDLVIQETLDKVKNGKCCLDPYDAVFIDEGQDFNDEMLEIALALLKPDGDLVIGLDSYQDLYRRKRSWKSLGIKAAGRTRYLKRVYRNTLEIFDFTQRYAGEMPKIDKQLALLPNDFAFHGELPELICFQSYEEIEDFLIKDLNQSIDEEEYKKSEIAIIYDDKIYNQDGFTYDNRALPTRFLERLDSSGIPAMWISQDARAKEMYDITTDRVSLISIHSSKGLDFDLVYLLGIDRILPTDYTRKNLSSLIYVAMTRAKYRLVIPYVEESEFIQLMKECLAKAK